MPRGCHKAVHVRMDGRYFIVEFDAYKEVLRIKQRKQLKPPMSGVYDASWWTAKSHVLGSSNTMPKRVIAAARYKMVEDATP